MKRFTNIAFLFGILVLAGFTSCLEKETYPNVPALTFKSFATQGDSGIITVTFTDGDGDVGLDDGDTVAPFQASGEHYHNLYIDYYDLIDGVWTFRDFGATSFHYRIPPIIPKDQSKPLKGDIQVILEPQYFFPGTQDEPASDSIRFAIRLKDRSLNVSNEVYSDTIIVVP